MEKKGNKNEEEGGLQKLDMGLTEQDKAEDVRWILKEVKSQFEKYRL